MMKKNLNIILVLLIFIINSCGENNNKNHSVAIADSVSKVNDSLVIPKDTVILIGKQTWMTKNLNVDKFRNGDPIPEVSDSATWANLTTPAWCYYKNDATNALVYGKLYNWYAVNDPRGLAPEGFHVPAYTDWELLEKFLGGELKAGGEMKEAGFAHWAKPNYGATNNSGFDALPGGYRYNNGKFKYMRMDGIWWSATEQDKFSSWSRYIGYNTPQFFRDGNLKSNGFSVRCLKNELVK